MPYQESLTQQHKFIHAGAIAAIADSAAGYAVFTLAPPKSSVLTAEYKINLLSPGKGESIVARARVIRSGRTLTVVSCDVFAIENGSEKQFGMFLGAALDNALASIVFSADGRQNNARSRVQKLQRRP